MFAKILLFIKSMSLAAKVTVIAATVVVVGGTTTAVVIVSQNHGEPTSSHQDEFAQNDQPTETGEQPKEDEKPEDDSENKEEAEQNNNQTSTQEPTTDPVQPTPTPEPEAPKSCSELQNCDYNLNDQYVIYVTTYVFWEYHDGCGTGSFCFLQKDENGNYYGDIWPIVDTRTYIDIGRFNGLGAGPDGDTSIVFGAYTVGGITAGVRNGPSSDYNKDYTETGVWKAHQYASANNYDYWPDIQAGQLADKEWTWQGVINAGYDLNEEKCAQWGLSCGRW